MRFSGGGGGSSKDFPCSPDTDARFGGGGVVAEFFRDLQLRNRMFTPHLVIFVGRDTQT